MYSLYLYTYVCTYVCVADSVSILLLFGVVAEIEESLILCYLSVTIKVNFLFFFLRRNFEFYVK